MRKRQVSFSGEVESVLKRKYNTPDPPVQKVKEKKSKPPSDQAYRPILKNLGLKIKRDFSGNNQNLATRKTSGILFQIGFDKSRSPPV